MGYYDLDLSNRRQYDLWWRIEQLDEYGRRCYDTSLDVVGYLLECRCPDDENPAQFRKDLAQVAYAFGGDAARDRFVVGSRTVDWGDDSPAQRPRVFASSSACQKAFAALNRHNVVFDASQNAYRPQYGRPFDRTTCSGFDALIGDGYVEIDYKYEHNQGVAYRVDITREGIEAMYDENRFARA